MKAEPRITDLSGADAPMAHPVKLAGVFGGHFRWRLACSLAIRQPVMM
jgi:hypothetical protein